MSTVVLIQAQPRDAGTGAAVEVRLAGGASRPYAQLGFKDWRGGVANRPRFASAIGFDQGGLTGGALPQTGGIRFAPSDRALLTRLAGLFWDGATITITTGDDEDPVPIYTTQLVGTVASHKSDGAALMLTVADLSAELNKAACPDTFAGTGGLEGGDDATGRVKRRTIGYAFNVEGRLLDKANSIYEFGDPRRSFTAFPMVKDKGREASEYVDVPWLGSAEETLDALRAAQAPQGGCARAPSISCVKWWTTPAGPLTADIIGEAGDGPTAPAVIASFIVSAYSTTIALANVAEARAWVDVASGVHIGDGTETVGGALDRLLLPVSIAWVLGADGVLTFRRLSWDGPVETLRADTIARELVYRPLKSRRLGFQRNMRQHSEAEISAALLLATDATYVDGTPIEVLKPATAGATAGSPIGTTIGGTVDPVTKEVEGGTPVESVIAALDQIPGLLDITRDTASSQRQMVDAARRLDELLLRTILDNETNRKTFRDAGIVADPATGTVRIYAVDSLKDRQTTVETTLDAVRGQLVNRVTFNDLNNAIAMAVLDPSQIAELGAIIGRLNSAELRLDAVEGEVALKATSIELGETDARVTDTESRLDAVEGEIENSVTRTEFDDVTTDIGSIKETLGSYGDVTSYGIDIRQARAVADDGAMARLREIAFGELAAQRRVVQEASAKLDIYSKITDVQAAESGQRLVLQAYAFDTAARLAEESTVRAEEGRVSAQRIAALAVADETQAAAIATAQTAAIAAGVGVAGVSMTIRQQIRDQEADAEALLRSIVEGEKGKRRADAQLVQIQTEFTTTLVADRIASATAREALAAQLRNAEAAIVTVSKVAAEENKATADRTTFLETALNDPDTGLTRTRNRVSSIETSINTPGTGYAARITSVESELRTPNTGLSARVSASEKAITDLDTGKASAQRVTDLETSVNDENTGLNRTRARVKGVEDAISDPNTGIARKLELLEADIDGAGGDPGLKAVVTFLREALVGPQGGLARAVLEVGVNGRIGRLRLTNNGQDIAAGFDADNFGVYDPDTGAVLFYVDADGAIAARFKPSAIGYDNLALGAVQKAAFNLLNAPVQIPRGASATVLSVPFKKEDADSILEIQAFIDVSSPDDLQFTGTMMLDGVALKSTPVNIVLDTQNSAGRMPITPFRFVPQVAAGDHTIDFVVTNNEVDNISLTVIDGSALKVVELRKASIGSVTGSGNVVITYPPAPPSNPGGGGGGGGGGEYNGGDLENLN